MITEDGWLLFITDKLDGYYWTRVDMSKIFHNYTKYILTLHFWPFILILVFYDNFAVFFRTFKPKYLFLHQIISILILFHWIAFMIMKKTLQITYRKLEISIVPLTWNFKPLLKIAFFFTLFSVLSNQIKWGE